jgi:hypothetical protein
MTRTNSRIVLLSIAAAAVFGATALPASAGEVSGNVDLATGYVFERFAVEVSGEPVVQPSVDWQVSEKLSASAWFSSDADEVFTDPFGNAGSEIDLTATYQVTDTTSFTAGRYLYPGGGDWAVGDWMAEVKTSAAGVDFTASGYWGSSDTMVFTAKKSFTIGPVELSPGLSYETRAGRIIGHAVGSVPLGDSGVTFGGILSASEGETVWSLKLSKPIGGT